MRPMRECDTWHRVLGFIRPFAAEEISQCEVDQDQTDDAGPNEIAGAEDIADKTSSREFCRESGHTRDEDCKE